MNTTTKLLQWFNEHGLWIPGIYLSRNKCINLWKNKTNQLNDGNRPIDYATKDLSMIEKMVDSIKYDIPINSSILELGSNCGINLNVLSKNGYHNINGMEINPHAIDEMYKSFPQLKVNIANISFEDGLKCIPSDSFDLIFSMAVLLHVHPSSNLIFDEIARISKKYICIVEAETLNCKYIFPRNYKRLFESRRFTEIKYIETMPDKEYSLRLLRKNKN
jgi:SAM-dependent methyltransferase